MDGWRSESFVISDIQSSPTGDERSSVCQLCQKQHALWKWDYVLAADHQMDVWYLHKVQKHKWRIEKDGWGCAYHTCH